jgi:hypothetical protein
MAWDNTAAIDDFEDCQLDEFGETVTFINGTSGHQTRIQAVRPTVTEVMPGFRSTTDSQRKSNIELLISRGGAGIVNIRPDVDSIKMKIAPSDAFEKICLIRYVKNEYGVWRVGLG